MQHSNHVIASGLLGPAARQGYTEGAIDFLNVISVQAALLQSQSQLVNVDTEINTRLVGLYRSLGGGWEIAD